MDEILEMAGVRGNGILFRRDLIALGLPPRAIDKYSQQGVLVPIRPGAFVPRAVAADPDAVHRAFVAASFALGGKDLVVSHLSAAGLHRLPIIGAWPKRLHVTSPAAPGGSSSPLVARHRGGSEPRTLVVDGVRVTDLPRTVVDVARTQPFECAVAMIDEVLSREAKVPGTGTTREALLAALHGSGLCHGVSRAEFAIAFGSHLSGSVGESLSRARIWQLGFELPELQVHFVCTRGEDRWVDFFWRRIRRIGEFDGASKYRAMEFTRGMSAADVVLEEKRREDALRPLVSGFMRWDWDTAISPRAFARFLTEHGVPSSGVRGARRPPVFA